MGQSLGKLTGKSKPKRVKIDRSSIGNPTNFVVRPSSRRLVRHSSKP